MINVLGRHTSSNVQIVLWCLAELGLDYTREDRGHSYGGVDTAEYLAMNPNGLVPVMIDEGEPLFESMAMLRYLASKHRKDETFWPSDPAKRAQIDKWAEWGKNSLGASISQGVFWPFVRTSPQDRKPAEIEAALGQMHKMTSILNDRLKVSSYVAGDSFTLADLAAGYMLYRYYTIDFDRPDLPEMADYYARLQKRPAYAQHVMVSYESLRAPGA